MVIEKDIRSSNEKFFIKYFCKCNENIPLYNIFIFRIFAIKNIVLRSTIMKKYFLFILILLFSYSIVFAQSKKRVHNQHEIGLFIGGSYYIGDLNPRQHFYMTRPAFGAFYRYAMDYRGAFRVGFNWGQIAGDDSQSDNKDQIERNLNFKTNIEEFYSTAEFNFWDYRIGNDKHFFTLFVFGGISVFHFNPMGDAGGSNWVDLRPLKTEGESKLYKLWQISIPFGVGIKVNVAKNIGLGLEWGPRKTFTDYLDDVSGSYPSLTQNPPNGSKGLWMSNKTKLPWSKITGDMRGNPSTKDWYFFTGLTINIRINRNVPCYTYGFDR